MKRKRVKYPYKISEKLKILFLLLINYKNINSIINNKNNYSKIYLINKNCLKDYKEEFKEIISLINKNEKIKENINKFNINSPFNSKNIDDMISNLNQESLKKIDEKLKQKNKPILSDIKSETVELINKKIIIYKEFIFVSQYIYDNIKNNFDNSINQQNISYLKHKAEDIITIETNKQYTILIGEIDKENNLYNIKFILEFGSNQLLNSEKRKILECKKDLIERLEKKLIFDKNR